MVPPVDFFLVFFSAALRLAFKIFLASALEGAPTESAISGEPAVGSTFLEPLVGLIFFITGSYLVGLPRDMFAKTLRLRDGISFVNSSTKAIASPLGRLLAHLYEPDAAFLRAKKLEDLIVFPCSAGLPDPPERFCLPRWIPVLGFEASPAPANCLAPFLPKTDDVAGFASLYTFFFLPSLCVTHFQRRLTAFNFPPAFFLTANSNDFFTVLITLIS